MEVKGRREDSGQLYKQKEEQQVELIDRILSDGNIEAAIHAVKSNRGAAGIDKMKVWLRNDFGPWMRHKVRVVILKQWKKPKTIQRKLSRLNAKLHCNMSDEDIYKTANSRLGWYGIPD